VTAVTSRTERISTRLDEVLSAINNTQQRIATNLERIAAIKARIPGVIDMVSLASTLVLLWIMLALSSLILHAWRYYQGESPFRRPVQ
jgi:uncharacterized membrane protein